MKQKEKQERRRWTCQPERQIIDNTGETGKREIHTKRMENQEERQKGKKFISEIFVKRIK